MLYERVRDRQILLGAWRTIRANAERSGNKRSRSEARVFEKNLIGNIESIQRSLRRGNYQFKKALGVTPSKGRGKGKRGIVVAPLRDRVVHRAILDVIYSCQSIPTLCDAISSKCSVGGVPGRGIGHALALIEHANSNGAKWFIRSDIRNFFSSFPRARVIDFLREQIADERFVELVERAITVELSNCEALGRDVGLFPLGEDGVAQGSPLSVLAGNIVLRDFDRQMNDRNIFCVRYIDDFVILGPNQRAVEKAFGNGICLLNKLGLRAYSPNDDSGKSSCGPTSAAYDFLGYTIIRGLNPPSNSSCRKLVEKIEAEIAEGKNCIRKSIRDDTSSEKVRQCYLQTLLQIDNIVRGWAGAFKHSRALQRLKALDNQIDTSLIRFDAWFGGVTRGLPGHVVRRAMGMRLLADTTPSPLPSIEDSPPLNGIAA